jgi:two-component system nitrate/nitrite response regulator NarL
VNAIDSTKHKVRILIADDHPIFRSGLRRLLESAPSFSVVGEAADGKQAVALAQELKPDILLLDVAMPGTTGLDALRELSASGMAVRTLLLTASIDRRQTLEALQLGASGVVLKGAETDLLFKSIQSVMAGQYWIGRDCVADIAQTLRELKPLPSAGARQKNYGLTPRELEVVAAIVSGCSNREVAQQFSISELTVKHHLRRIFDKVGVYSRLELALFALHHHLVESEAAEPAWTDSARSACSGTPQAHS